MSSRSVLKDAGLGFGSNHSLVPPEFDDVARRRLYSQAFRATVLCLLFSEIVRCGDACLKFQPTVKVKNNINIRLVCMAETNWCFYRSEKDMVC